MEDSYIAYQLFFKDFIQKYTITLSNEDRYHLYRFLTICNQLGDGIFHTMLQDVALSCYGLSRKHMQTFRELCYQYRIKSNNRD